MSCAPLDGSNRISRVLVAGLLAATGIVVIVGVVLVLRFVQEEMNGGQKHIAYMKGIDDARQAGIPVTPQMLQAPLPPSEQNAGPIYTQLTDLFAAKPLTAADAIIDQSPSRQMPSARQFELMRSVLKRRSAVVQLIHQAAARPQCAFVRDWSNPIAVPFKEFKTIRSAARILASESLLMAHGGKPVDAVRTMALGFKLAQRRRMQTQIRNMW